MGSRGGSVYRLSSTPSFGNRISFLLLSMFATMATLYVAGRLWQDASNREYMINELDARTGRGKTSVSVDDTLKVINCRERQKILDALHVDLEKARQEGFVSKPLSDNAGTTKRKLLAVIGILTMFGRKNNRHAIRKAWMPTGPALKKLEEEKGVVIRFVIGRSANQGDNSDMEIVNENKQSNDFIILDNHVEKPEERSNKTKLFLIHAVDNWEAEFYIKTNDDVYVNIDALGAVLASHLDKPRAYIGCMKSGEVFSDPKNKWYEPDSGKFGDGRSYFRHAAGEIFAISHSLARFVSINRLFLRTYAHDDISVGSWFIGLDVMHVDEGKFCCLSSSGAVCAST